ncbi:MAG: hypothetical protein IQL11_07145 [Bacteroidales bacterium]|nr:hypothetical protein [Bacteroidales bacterium]
MKTKTILFLFLLLSFGSANLFGQEWPEGTKSISVWDSYYFEIPVICNGTQVDFLTGTIEAHYVVHFINGEFSFQLSQANGEATSTSDSGEVFQLKSHDKIGAQVTSDPYSDLIFCNYVLLGNKGTRYLVSLTWSCSTGEQVVTRIKCK